MKVRKFKEKARVVVVLRNELDTMENSMQVP